MLPTARTKVFLILLLVLGLVGFSDATYLTIKHYTGGTIPCTILDGCDTVTTSAYSELAGIPIAIFGALFYLSVILLVIAYWQTGKEGLLKLLWFLSLGAFLASLMLIYLQGWVIGYWCLYCLGSAITSTLIFGLTTVFYRRPSTRSVAA